MQSPSAVTRKCSLASAAVIGRAVINVGRVPRDSTAPQEFAARKARPVDESSQLLTPRARAAATCTVSLLVSVTIDRLYTPPVRESVSVEEVLLQAGIPMSRFVK